MTYCTCEAVCVCVCVCVCVFVCVRRELKVNQNHWDSVWVSLNLLPFAVGGKNALIQWFHATTPSLLTPQLRHSEPDDGF